MRSDQRTISSWQGGEERVNFENSSLIAKRRSVLRSLEISKCVAKSVIWYFSTPLYVDDLVEESELVERQTGAPLGERARLAARVAASPIALSPNGCKGKKSRIARRGKPR